MKEMWAKVSAYVKANTMKVGLWSAAGIVVVAAIVATVCLWPGLKDKNPSNKDPGAWTEEQIQNQQEAEKALDDKKEAEEITLKAEEAAKAAAEAARLAQEEAERLAKEEADKKAAEEAALKAEQEHKAAEEAARKAEEAKKKAEAAAKVQAEAEKNAYEARLEETSQNLTSEQKEQIAVNAATCRHCGRSKADGKHHRFVSDMTCPDCGVFVEGMTCHVCAN